MFFPNCKKVFKNLYYSLQSMPTIFYAFYRHILNRNYLYGVNLLSHRRVIPLLTKVLIDCSHEAFFYNLGTSTVALSLTNICVNYNADLKNFLFGYMKTK